ncbi:MAG: hypothetical protein AB7O45_00565 [Alphaproteobacteria bacterium]
MAGEGEPSHAEIIRSLGERIGAVGEKVAVVGEKVSNMEGRRLERDKSLDDQLDAGRARMSAIEARLGGLEVTAAETRVVVDAVQKTATETDKKVDRLLALMERGKGAAWAFAKAWGWLIALGGFAAAALAYVATNLSAVKKLFGIGG